MIMYGVCTMFQNFSPPAARTVLETEGLRASQPVSSKKLGLNPVADTVTEFPISKGWFPSTKAKLLTVFEWRALAHVYTRPRIILIL